MVGVEFMSKRTKISILSLTQTDEPFLWDMVYLAIFVPEGFPHPSPNIVNRPEVAKYVAGWGGEHDSGFLAVDVETRQPVGAAWLRLFTGKARGYGYVDDDTPELSIAVQPNYRSSGIGTALLTCLFEAAAGNYPAISLSVHAHNPAFKLYRRLGFEIVLTTRSAITMKKVLKTNSEMNR